MSLADAQAGIIWALESIPGLRAYDFPFAGAQPPFAHVFAYDTVDFDQVYDDDTGRFELIVTLCVGASDERTAVQKLYGYLAASGDDSIRGVINADPTLDGRVDSCRLVQARNGGDYLVGGKTYLGTQLVFDVIG